ncbi:MAG: hypothetical protein GX415_05590 [Chloroflexi bacterium]|jgi:uncharacterized protein YebE (UPF0316 family)|nr:hypothetical protein [Anaerolineaceae bacterium]NLI44867.1 hypothetical protein [Chloroflexota bacterium]HOE34844.1 DUF5698 domain-containing protein [Anaerolineaceae bacterium]HOT25966.1 DUF5698 domain-containing protein [Anaerolineaceae bacterium]HQK04050.1 DUF5698 domain-containing protein [Anaerolineaceae bacterium]
MDFLLNLSPVLGALLIFFLRLINYTMDTLRIMLTMRNKKLLSWILGFFESILFVVVMGAVLDDLDNPLKVIAYAGGFATGNVVGMIIEKRLAIGYSHISIISRGKGREIAEALRAHDFAVTEIPAFGRDGRVTLLNCSVQRKLAADVERVALEQDPEAFITIEDVIPRQRGYWGRTGVNR